MTRLHLHACGVAWTLALGCGGGQQTAKDASLVTTPAPSAAVIAEEPPDLSPVPAPTDLVLVGRFKNPRAAAETVAKWAGIPFALVDLVPDESRSIAKLIDWQAPIEVAVALDPRGEGKVPQPLAVASIGIASLTESVSAARASGATVRRVQPGVFRVNVADPLSCALAASVGRAPARLICGERWKDVEELLGYMTRGLPSQSLGEADLVVDIGVEPIQRRYSRDLAGARLFLGMALRQIELDSPRFDRALADVAYAAADELVALVNDLDRLRVEATLDQQREELSISGRLKFKGQTSWTVQTAQAIPSGGAPPEFFRLPNAATNGSFAHGVPQERVDPLARALADLTEGYLEAEKLPRASRERWRRLVERMFKLGGTTVYSEGDFDELPATDALAKNALGGLGWVLYYLPNPPGQVTAMLNDLVVALDDPAFKRLLKEKFNLEDAMLPRFKKRALNVPHFKGQGLLVEVTASSELLSGMDSIFDVDTEKTHGGFVLAAVPDGAGTWLAGGPDEKRLLSKVAELRGDSSKRHPAVRHLAQAKAVSGGFMTLLQLLGGLPEIDDVKERKKLATSLPQRGLTPIVDLETVEREPGGTTLALRMHVPRAAIADTAALLPKILGEGFEGFLSGPVGRAPLPPKTP